MFYCNSIPTSPPHPLSHLQHLQPPQRPRRLSRPGDGGRRRHPSLNGKPYEVGSLWFDLAMEHGWKWPIKTCFIMIYLLIVPWIKILKMLCVGACMKVRSSGMLTGSSCVKVWRSCEVFIDLYIDLYRRSFFDDHLKFSWMSWYEVLVWGPDRQI